MDNYSAAWVVAAFDATLVILGAFLGLWGYAVHEYGWFLGLSLGWIPSAIFAAAVAGLTWLGYFYIPANVPALRFITVFVALANGIGALVIVLGLLYWLAVAFFGVRNVFS